MKTPNELLWLHVEDPGDGVALCALTRVYLEQGRVEEALRFGCKALSPLQGDASLAEAVGRLFEEHGLTDEAHRCFARAQELEVRALQCIKEPEIVAIGDVHGEIEGLRALLRHAKAIDARGQWIGRRLIAVQVGDVIDRGPKPIEAWELLTRLQRQGG